MFTHVSPCIDNVCACVCMLLLFLNSFFCEFRWYSLKGKPGSKKADQSRGELEVTATFLVQQKISQSQSSLSLEKKTKKSLSVRNLAHTFSNGTLVACFFIMTYYCNILCIIVLLVEVEGAAVAQWLSLGATLTGTHISDWSWQEGHLAFPSVL